ncbi:hypothetical protein ACFLTG_03485 [Chloroflexota bacterium]
MSCTGEDCIIREYEIVSWGGSSEYKDRGSPEPDGQQWSKWSDDLKKTIEEFLKNPPTGCHKDCQCVKNPAGQNPEWSEEFGVLFQKAYEITGYEYHVGRNATLKFRDFTGKCHFIVINFPVCEWKGEEKKEAAK